MRFAELVSIHKQLISTKEKEKKCTATRIHLHHAKVPIAQNPPAKILVRG